MQGLTKVPISDTFGLFAAVLSLCWVELASRVLIHHLVYERVGTCITDESTKLYRDLGCHADDYAIMTFYENVAIIDPNFTRLSVRLNLR